MTAQTPTEKKIPHDIEMSLRYMNKRRQALMKKRDAISAKLDPIAADILAIDAAVNALQQ